jgi:hypothetical protein
MTNVTHQYVASRRASPNASRADLVRSDMRSVLPGISFAGAIAAVSLFTCHIPGMATFSPMILGHCDGDGISPNRWHSFAKPGIAFSIRRQLRFAIVLAFSST